MSQTSSVLPPITSERDLIREFERQESEQQRQKKLELEKVQHRRVYDGPYPG